MTGQATGTPWGCQWLDHRSIEWNKHMKKILYLLSVTIFFILIIAYRTLQVDTVNMQDRVLENIDRVQSTTPLHMAVIMNNINAIKGILNVRYYRNPGTVKSQDGEGHYPLYYVGQYRPRFRDYIFGRPDIEIAELLIKNGADVNANNGEVIDQALSGWGNIEFIRMLLKNGFDIKNRSVLHRAARGRLVDIVKLLIDYGADVNERNEEGETPLDYAKWPFGDEATRNELKKAGAKE